MKATLIDQRRFAVFTRKQESVLVRMDLFNIHGSDAFKYPGGVRFSWIAFLAENPLKRVLFDSHPPKGPHFHLDDKSDETAFTWEGLEKMESLFFEKVAKHFDIDPEELQ